MIWLRQHESRSHNFCSARDVVLINRCANLPPFLARDKLNFNFVGWTFLMLCIGVNNLREKPGWNSTILLNERVMSVHDLSTDFQIALNMAMLNFGKTKEGLLNTISGRWSNRSASRCYKLFYLTSCVSSTYVMLVLTPIGHFMWSLSLLSCSKNTMSTNRAFIIKKANTEESLNSFKSLATLA